jgi:hypothetical protein
MMVARSFTPRGLENAQEISASDREELSRAILLPRLRPWHGRTIIKTIRTPLIERGAAGNVDQTIGPAMMNAVGFTAVRVR